MDFQDVVRRRRSVRRYDLSRPVPPEVTDRILRNALKAPSAGFSQGWGFLALDTPEDVARFRAAATPEQDADNWFAAKVEAPLIVVAHSNKSAYLERYAQADKGHADRTESWWPAPYWDIDAGFASMLMLLSAIDADLGACFFGIPVDRHGHYRAAFGVPPEFTPIGAISIGYPAEPARPIRSGRKAPAEVLYRHEWGTPALDGRRNTSL
ncbi:MAG TPA: nitroreductase family protein [Streptosporangiales bacterium]